MGGATRRDKCNATVSFPVAMIRYKEFREERFLAGDLFANHALICRRAGCCRRGDYVHKIMRLWHLHPIVPPWLLPQTWSAAAVTIFFRRGDFPSSLR